MRRFKIPITINTFIELHDISNYAFKFALKKVRRNAKDVKYCSIGTNPISCINVKALIQTSGIKLKLTKEAITKAQELATEGEKHNIFSGRNPVTVAGACLYTASYIEHEKRSQRDICDIINLTEVSVRNMFHIIVETLGLEGEVTKGNSENTGRWSDWRKKSGNPAIEKYVIKHLLVLDKERNHYLCNSACNVTKIKSVFREKDVTCITCSRIIRGKSK